MSGRGDDWDARDDRDERPRLSWKEIDQRRSRPRERNADVRPRGRVAEARAKRATHEYLKKLDGMFAGDPGGAEGEKLAAAVRDAHGSDALREACGAYCRSVGDPGDPSLAALFLDVRDRDVVLAGLRGLQTAQEAGGWKPSSGLRSQLRLLAQDSDDEIAEASEDLLEAITAT